MKKQQVIQSLANSKAKLISRFGITRLALFGSTARDNASDNSDVDVLVGFDGLATSQRYFGVQFYLRLAWLFSRLGNREGFASRVTTLH